MREWLILENRRKRNLKKKVQSYTKISGFSFYWNFQYSLYHKLQFWYITLNHKGIKLISLYIYIIQNQLSFVLALS